MLPNEVSPSEYFPVLTMLSYYQRNTEMSFTEFQPLDRSPTGVVSMQRACAMTIMSFLSLYRSSPCQNPPWKSEIGVSIVIPIAPSLKWEYLAHDVCLLNILLLSECLQTTNFSLCYILCLFSGFISSTMAGTSSNLSIMSSYFLVC